MKRAVLWDGSFCVIVYQFSAIRSEKTDLPSVRFLALTSGDRFFYTKHQFLVLSIEGASTCRKNAANNRFAFLHK